MRLDPTATFRTLIPGRTNAEAIELARRAVGRSHGRPSPVVFMGPSGSGKSHLLRAAANDFLRRNPSARVLILTANEFFISYLASIFDATFRTFRRTFAEDCDALFVDQLEDLRGLAATREMLYSFVETVSAKGGPVLLATTHTGRDLLPLVWQIPTIRGASLLPHTAKQRQVAVRRMLRKSRKRLPVGLVNDLATRSPGIVEAKQAVRRELVLRSVPRGELSARLPDGLARRSRRAQSELLRLP